jgi:hypothetical protein
MKAYRISYHHINHIWNGNKHKQKSSYKHKVTWFKIPPADWKLHVWSYPPKKNTPSGARSQICGCICVHPLLHLRIHHCHAKKNGSSRRASALALAGHCGCTCQVSETWTARWNWRIFEGWGWWNLNGEKPLSEALPGFILVNIARQGHSLDTDSWRTYQK